MELPSKLFKVNILQEPHASIPGDPLLHFVFNTAFPIPFDVINSYFIGCITFFSSIKNIQGQVPCPSGYLS